MEDKEFIISILNAFGYEYDMEELERVLSKEPINGTKKCICFSRVSTIAQDIEQQTVELLDEARRNGFKEEDIILIEQKESAVKLDIDERIGIQKLKNAIESNDVECVIIFEISRLSRRPDVLYNVRDYLISKKVNLVCMKPYMKLLDSDGNMSQTASLIFSIFGSLAEQEGYIRKVRMKRGKDKAKALGKHYTGRVPFGYSVNKEKQYIINEDTALVVKKIFEMYTDGGMSLRRIVKEVKERGYFTDITFHGCVRNIHEMLHREYYYGANEHMPAIISKELFDKAQEIKHRKTIEVTRTPVKALCKAILFNKDNGHMLTVNTSLGTYYTHSGGISIRQCIIEPIVWEYSTKTHSEYYIKDYDKMLKIIEHDLRVVTNKYMTAQNQIEKYKNQLNKLEERVILGKVNSELADKMESNIKYNIHNTINNMHIIHSKQEQLRHQQANILDESKKQYDYTMFDLDDKIALIHKVIERVELYRKDKKLHIEIHNKYNSDVEEITLVRKWRNWEIEK